MRGSSSRIATPITIMTNGTLSTVCATTSPSSEPSRPILASAEIERDGNDDRRHDQRRHEVALGPVAAGEAAAPQAVGCQPAQHQREQRRDRRHAGRYPHRVHPARIAEEGLVPAQREAGRREGQRLGGGEGHRDHDQDRHGEEQQAEDADCRQQAARPGGAGHVFLPSDSSPPLGERLGEGESMIERSGLAPHPALSP